MPSKRALETFLSCLSSVVIAPQSWISSNRLYLSVSPKMSLLHTLFLVFFFFLLSFSLKPSGNILSFCYIGFGHFLHDFSLDILCFCLFFYCEWNLWVTPSFLLLLIPHTNLLASAAGSQCIWTQSEPMLVPLKSSQATSFTLGHRLVSTHSQGPVPTHLPEVASYNLWHHTRVSFKVLQCCYTAPKYDLDSQRWTA